MINNINTEYKNANTHNAKDISTLIANRSNE